MKKEYQLVNGSKYEWPIIFKLGIFRTDKKGKFRINFRVRPLFLFYVFIPGIVKFWMSVEKNVISVMYLGFLECGDKRND